ncbi:MAG: ABC-type phosphate/phosphonate transport system substrate-binding protein [Pirellulaceae bacterium]|jgi:ABC-type phosphate/phosphonate transport system substrate-binding protein
MNSRFTLLGLFCLTLVASPLRGEPVSRLLVGIQTSQTTKEINSQYAVTAQRMRDRISEATGNSVEVQFIRLPTQDIAIAALTQGRVDVVALDATGFVSALKSQPHITLLCEQRKGTQPVQGAIVVHLESNATKLAELAGQTIAFGPKYASTTGLIAQAEFVRSAVRRYDVLTVNDLQRTEVLAGVRSGDFAAGAIEQAASDNASGVRVLHRFPSIGRLWASRGEVDMMTNLAIQNALLQDPDYYIVADAALTAFCDSMDLGLKFDN